MIGVLAGEVQVQRGELTTACCSHVGQHMPPRGWAGLQQFDSVCRWVGPCQGLSVLHPAAGYSLAPLATSVQAGSVLRAVEAAERLAVVEA